MADQQPTAGAPQQQFALQRIFVRDLSFEVPMGPQVFTKQWQPQVQIDLGTRSEHVADDIYEAVLTITVTAKLGTETAFLIELQQAGLFLVRGMEGERLQRLLMVACPNILFPYAREAIDSMSLRGSFPPLALQPVNFEALYQQAQQEAQTNAN